MNIQPIYHAKRALASWREVCPAVSGGIDSMVMLHALHNLKKVRKVLHVNHNLRGAESLAEQEMVSMWCDRLKVPFVTTTLDIQPGRGESTEMACRRQRYDWLFKNCDTYPIAAGHHTRDQLETILMRIGRGTSLQGLSGMVQHTTLKQGRIVRPFLYLNRSDIVQYAHENNVPYKTDSSNLTTEYTRNRVRQNIIPAIEQEYPAVYDHITAMSSTLVEDHNYLNKQAEQAFVVMCDYKKHTLDSLDNLDKAIARRVMVKYLTAIGVPHDSISHKLLKSLLHVKRPKECQLFTLPGRIVVQRTPDKFTVIW